MEDNKIDINSLIGFFLIGFIFIGWLWLNPPPETPISETENRTNSVQIDTNNSNVTSSNSLSDVVAKKPDDQQKNLSLSLKNSISEKGEIVKPKINTEEAFSEPLIRLDEVKYLLKEERRIFKNEVHYFDHPKIGIIVSVYSSL